uniref:Venom peptide SjAPI-like n=1 Tax=Diabrotica virgifera virgifera TaxID=50390 RepID=A0A6P7GLU6_DIAVI
MKLFLVFLLVAVMAHSSLQKAALFPTCDGENEVQGCEPCCPELEVSCQKKVPGTCPSPICLAICKLKCVCAQGYLRDQVSGKCVKDC